MAIKIFTLLQYILHVYWEHVFLKTWALLVILPFPYLFIYIYYFIYIYCKPNVPIHIYLSSLKIWNIFPALRLSPFLLLVSFKSISLINWLYKQSFKFSLCLLIFFQSSTYWSKHLINRIKLQYHLPYPTLGHFCLKKKNAEVCFYSRNDYNLKCCIGYVHYLIR